MKNKGILLAVILAFSSIAVTAAVRYNWVVPVNQKGEADTYALPCTVVRTEAATGAVVPVSALAVGGAAYWISLDKAATAGDYAILRDSATANATSTASIKVANASTTGSSMVQFNPPMRVLNGISIDVSSQTTGATVCVRRNDGGI